MKRRNGRRREGRLLKEVREGEERVKRELMKVRKQSGKVETKERNVCMKMEERDLLEIRKEVRG